MKNLYRLTSAIYWIFTSIMVVLCIAQLLNRNYAWAVIDFVLACIDVAIAKYQGVKK